MDRLQAMSLFVRVVELGSFTEAARALSLSRARASEAISGLEAALGARLLHRTTRRLSLTDDGRSYYERARRILSEVEEAELELKTTRSRARGQLRVDVPVALARLFLVPRLPELFSRHPELELLVRLQNRPANLVRDGVDCAISYGKPRDPDLVLHRLSGTHLVTCASALYLSRRGVPVAPAQLSDHSCIRFLDSETARPQAWIFGEAAETPSLEVTGNLAFNSMEACLEAASAGLGITQVSSSIAQPALDQGQLVEVLPEFRAVGPELYLVHPANARASARLRVFIEFARRVFTGVEGSYRAIR
ncbi:MAG TPA: LysR family transcriptional regulator [Polyangiaceae bacterium]|nr:LysR family transcriptional regulator [Polyangiaceae bacterium]